MSAADEIDDTGRDHPARQREGAGRAPPVSPVVLTMDRVSRITASLRNGWRNDAEAQIIPLAVADLDSAVRSFGGCPIYGWEFIDPPGESWSHWRERLTTLDDE